MILSSQNDKQKQTPENEAEKLANILPSLLIEAKRVASTVAQGVHGRKRAGPGDTFWQFRNFAVGDTASQIDWRRSAGSSHLFVREREWEAAHTIWIWPDLSPSMQFRSHLSRYSKWERVVVLSLALASLLSDAGERVGLPGYLEPNSRRNICTAMLDVFARVPAKLVGLPKPHTRLGRHSEIIILSDFLEPQNEIGEMMTGLANQGVRGHIVQILDPAEETLPYQGRVEFIDQEQGTRYVAGRAETLRDDYILKFRVHKDMLAQTATHLGWTPFLHHTDRPSVEALLPLHLHLSGLQKGYRKIASGVNQTTEKAGLI